MKLSQAIKAMVATGTVVMSASAMSATTATVDLNADVANINSIEVTGPGSYDLDLNVPISDKNIGNLILNNNDVDGFKVLVDSTRGGLKSEERHVIKYAITFTDIGGGDKDGTDHTVMEGNNKFVAGEGKRIYSFDRTVRENLPGPSAEGATQDLTYRMNLALRHSVGREFAGNYSDTVNFEIRDL